jgi:fructosamine-3-kinase
MQAKTRDRIVALADGMHRVVLDDGRQSVVKRMRGAPAGFFSAEASGLAALRPTRTLRVPDVYALAADTLVLEDLGHGSATAAAWRDAGGALARLHATTSAARFGFENDGWCGLSPQPNTFHDDGFEFFADRRLLFQGRRAFDAGRLTPRDLGALERLCAELPSRVPNQSPVLVHGDLWIANLHACANGELALIDAGAAHYGWAETDLAMLTLFGSPPPAFFDAYETTAGIDSSWRSRAPLYNLYHLLNHLNLFGDGYLGSVRSILRTT